jgi:hypothetical protein
MILHANFVQGYYFLCENNVLYFLNFTSIGCIFDHITHG